MWITVGYLSYYWIIESTKASGIDFRELYLSNSINDMAYL